MPVPNLTIDFVGLNALAVDYDECGEPEKIYVLMIDAPAIIPDARLCKHVPVLIVDSESFEEDGPNIEQTSFQLDRQDIGAWLLDKLWLQLGNVDDSDGLGSLTIDHSCGDILDHHKLIGSPRSIDRSWLDLPNNNPVKGIAGILEINRGRLSVLRMSDYWYLDLPGKRAPDPCTGTTLDSEPPDLFQFASVLRWEVFARGADGDQHLKLEATNRTGQWMWFEDRGHITISNLCGLNKNLEIPSRDVLVYYELADCIVPACRRRVLYPEGYQGGDTRPGSEACPPLIGALS
jgi:hypothetical protein